MPGTRSLYGRARLPPNPPGPAKALLSRQLYRLRYELTVSVKLWVALGHAVGGSDRQRGGLPAGVVAVTSTVPVPAGLSAVIAVPVTTVTSVAAAVPKSTTVAPVKPVPVIVTSVPPAAGPLVGLRPVTAGAPCK